MTSSSLMTSQSAVSKYPHTGSQSWVGGSGQPVRALTLFPSEDIRSPGELSFECHVLKSEDVLYFFDIAEFGLKRKKKGYFFFTSYFFVIV